MWQGGYGSQRSGKHAAYSAMRKGTPSRPRPSCMRPLSAMANSDGPQNRRAVTRERQRWRAEDRLPRLVGDDATRRRSAGGNGPLEEPCVRQPDRGTCEPGRREQMLEPELLQRRLTACSTVPDSSKDHTPTDPTAMSENHSAR